MRVENFLGVRPQPQTSFFLILTFCLLSAHMCPFVRLSGDLSKVQWLPGLQILNLNGCGLVEGKFLA